MIRASYSEVYDLQTEDGKITALKIHSPQDGAPAAHLGGLFAQFRKYKYLGADVTMIPAQTLPLDALNISTDPQDTNKADPRDLLNPILYKGWNGERTLVDLYIDQIETLRGSMGVLTDGDVPPGNASDDAGGQSIDGLDVPLGEDNVADVNTIRMYAAMLADPSWKKSGVMDSFSMHLRPLVWNVTSARPFGNYADISGSGVGIADPLSIGVTAVGTDQISPFNAASGNLAENMKMGAMVPLGADEAHYHLDLMTSGMTELGWQPTNNLLLPINTSASGLTNTGNVQIVNEVTRLRVPMVFMGLIVLPPAYKTNFFYRLIVTHTFLFSEMSSLKSIDAIDAQAATLNEMIPIVTANLRKNDLGDGLPTPESRLVELSMAAKEEEPDGLSSLEVINGKVVKLGDSLVGALESATMTSGTLMEQEKAMKEANDKESERLAMETTVKKELAKQEAVVNAIREAMKKTE